MTKKNTIEKLVGSLMEIVERQDMRSIEAAKLILEHSWVLEYHKGSLAPSNIEAAPPDRQEVPMSDGKPFEAEVSTDSASSSVSIGTPDMNIHVQATAHNDGTHVEIYDGSLKIVDLGVVNGIDHDVMMGLISGTKSIVEKRGWMLTYYLAAQRERAAVLESLQDIRRDTGHELPASLDTSHGFVTVLNEDTLRVMTRPAIGANAGVPPSKPYFDVKCVAAARYVELLKQHEILSKEISTTRAALRDELCLASDEPVVII